MEAGQDSAPVFPIVINIQSVDPSTKRLPRLAGRARLDVPPQVHHIRCTDIF